MVGVRRRSGLRDGVRRVYDARPRHPKILRRWRSGARGRVQRSRTPSRVHHIAIRHIFASDAGPITPWVSA